MVGRVVRALLCVAVVGLGHVRPLPAQEAPPAAAPGTITGVILDKSTGQPLVDAGVEVVGQNVSTRTDLDGKYVLKAPPGTYDVRVYAAGMQGMRLQGVLVKAGQTSHADAALAPSGQPGLVVEVVAPARKATEAAQILQRKTAAAVSETISAESIKKTPGSDAAAVVRRAPAVTVKDDRFVFVRGLGERYTQATLDGSKLPSTDPQKRVVPLDLFPASFLDSLNIIKTFTPNLPGDFAGGLIDLDLRDFPPAFQATLSSQIGGNTQATFRDFQTYRGSPYDYVGMGDGFRALPEGMPGRDVVQALGTRGAFRVARQFRDIWAVEDSQAPPNNGVGFTVGNTFGKFGFQLGASYSNEYKRFRDVIERQFQATTSGTPPTGPGNQPFGPGTNFEASTDFRRQYSMYVNKIGGVLTGAYKPDENNKLTFRSLIQRNAYDNVQTGTGEIVASTTTQQQSVFRYTTEELDYGQLSGEHRLPWLSINWRTALARTAQEEPDTRFNARNVISPGVSEFTTDSLGGTRVFNTLRENLTDNALDAIVPYKVTLPWGLSWPTLPGKFQFGPAFTYRDRHSLQRRFEFDPTQGGRFDLTDPTQKLLNPNNIGANGVNFVETTLPTDKFSATQEIIAGYGLFDMYLWPDIVRVVAGVRPQYSFIVLNTFNQQNGQDFGKPVKIIKNDFDPLPGINLTYSPRSDMNVRAAWSKTVSYPEFRELSPSLFLAPRGEDSIVGNPDLISAHITSWDLRWEWFMSPLELVSLSFFRKQLKDPIERTQLAVSSGTQISFVNAQAATITGMEFEGRKDLGFLASRLEELGLPGSRFRYLSFLANFTYAASTTTVPRGKFQVQTSTERQFQGQAPYILNLSLDYTDPTWGTARVLYNRVGSTLFLVGAYGIPDRFEEPRNQLDAVFIFPLQHLINVPLTAQLNFENLLNDRYLITQGDVTQNRFTKGVKITLGLTYSFD